MSVWKQNTIHFSGKYWFFPKNLVGKIFCVLVKNVFSLPRSSAWCVTCLHGVCTWRLIIACWILGVLFTKTFTQLWGQLKSFRHWTCLNEWNPQMLFVPFGQNGAADALQLLHCSWCTAAVASAIAVCVGKQRHAVEKRSKFRMKT